MVQTKAEPEDIRRTYFYGADSKRVALHSLLLSPRIYYRTYRRDIEAWLHDCVDWPQGKGPTPYQVEIMVDMVTHGREAVVGPHGLGKTTTAALVINWFSSTREAGKVDWKIPTTASNHRQLRHFLWPEVHKWSRRLRWDRIARDGPYKPRSELLDTEIQLEHGRAYAAVDDRRAGSKESGGMEGAHADSLLYLFDESKLVPTSVFDSAEGAISGAGPGTGQEGFMLAQSTPGPKMGRFYEIHARRPGLTNWKARHVTIEECIAAGRVSPRWVEEKQEQWGEQSALYQNKVLGKFASDEDGTIIPLAWVEAAIDRWYEWTEAGKVKAGLPVIGADIAYSGMNKTVFAVRWGRVITELRKYAYADTMATAGRLKGLAESINARVVVDLTGFGAGVYDRLREERVKGVSAFVAASKHEGFDSTGEQGFANARSAAWWQMREALDPSYGSDIALPPDDDLIGELTTPLYKIVGAGKILVEGKDDISRRIEGRSTDNADAVIMAFYQPPPAAVDPKSIFMPMVGAVKRQ